MSVSHVNPKVLLYGDTILSSLLIYRIINHHLYLSKIDFCQAISNVSIWPIKRLLFGQPRLKINCRCIVFFLQNGSYSDSISIKETSCLSSKSNFRSFKKCNKIRLMVLLLWRWLLQQIHNLAKIAAISMKEARECITRIERNLL